MKFCQVFWDFDGTLFNSYPMVAEDIRQALINLDMPVPKEKELLRLVKTTLGEAALSFAKGDKDKADRLFDEYKNIALKRDPSKIPMYDGALEILKSIVNHGGQNYLYTHRDKSAVCAVKSKNALPLFKDIITSENGFPRKPAPDAINHIISKYNLSKDACCMVGDRPIDLDAAKNAGIASILFDPENYYPDYKCDYRFASFPDMQLSLFDSII